MPLSLNGDRVPPRCAEQLWPQSLASVERFGTQGSVQIALINNMPDAALEDTELQFFELLEAACGDIPVNLTLYSLPGVPRSERARQRLSQFYHDIDDLFERRFDGVIMTGTEPRQPDLRNEPYWAAVAEVLDWAERSTVSMVLSCLAAHASVLHSDGIVRRTLSDKRFGVFECRRVGDHALTQGTPELMRFPHSRWNEVPEEALVSCGYQILTKSADAGIDLFVKKKAKSLFVYFQGHPEYGARTLWKEYRRDVRRFLVRERETYPSAPHGYFDAASAGVLADFRERALVDRREALLADFPDAHVTGALEKTWHLSGTCVYSNWLRWVSSKKAPRPRFAISGAVCAQAS